MWMPSRQHINRSTGPNSTDSTRTDSTSTITMPITSMLPRMAVEAPGMVVQQRPTAMLLQLLLCSRHRTALRVLCSVL